MSHAEGSCCADAMSPETREARQYDLKSGEVENASFWKHDLNFVFMWSLRLLRFVVMVGMKTSWVVRKMLWAVFG